MMRSLPHWTDSGDVYTDAPETRLWRNPRTSCDDTAGYVSRCLWWVRQRDTIGGVIKFCIIKGLHSKLHLNIPVAARAEGNFSPDYWTMNKFAPHPAWKKKKQQQQNVTSYAANQSFVNAWGQETEMTFAKWWHVFKTLNIFPASDSIQFVLWLHMCFSIF